MARGTLTAPYAWEGERESERVMRVFLQIKIALARVPGLGGGFVLFWNVLSAADLRQVLKGR